MLNISPAQARKIALLHQGLLRSKTFAKRELGILQVMARLGYLQIDTISVITRAHHHTMWSRLADYQPEHLYDLQKKKEIFEYWSHAAAYLPLQHYRFTLPRKHALASGEKHWYEREPKVIQYVLDRIGSEGPLQSKDFQHVNPSGNSAWYQWKPAKRALEQLFMEGKLMIAERKNFQKVFDLTERVLPSNTDTRFPSEKEMARHLILTYLTAHGIGSEPEFTYLRKRHKKIVHTELKQMCEEGVILPVQIKGLDLQLYALPTIEESLSLRIGKKNIHILSPFDNLVIQRKRLQDIFGFSYQIECYVPQAKRVHGYFSLPILWGDQFVGRVDCKADRKSKQFLIQHLWLETEEKIIDQYLQALVLRLKQFAAFHHCDSYVVNHCSHQHLIPQLEKFLAM